MKSCAVIVVYSNDLTITQRLVSTLITQDVFCIIVDNSTYNFQSSFSYPKEQLHYLFNGENLGIAAAQNRGLVIAKSLGFDTAFLFDQDSTISNDYSAIMLETLQELNSESRVFAAIGPAVRCEYTGKLEKPFVQRHQGEATAAVVKVPQIIASGMLIDMSTLSDIGYHDEALFIDAVDHEWCWRARKKGYMIGLNRRVTLLHRLGERRLSLFGIKFKIGQPVRLYYQTRNLILLSTRGYVPLYWKCRNWLYLPLKILINGLFVTPRLKRLYFFCKGIKDGLLQRVGAID